MGYRYNTQMQAESVNYFRAVEISGSLQIGLDRKIPFAQILLLSNDMETLFFAENNMFQLVNNTIRMIKMNNSTVNNIDGSGTFAREFESLLESIIMRPEKNILNRLSASLKKAILSIALDRYHSNKEMICKVLGLSSSQFDHEMRSIGFDLLTNKEK